MIPKGTGRSAAGGVGLTSRRPPTESLSQGERGLARHVFTEADGTSALRRVFATHRISRQVRMSEHFRSLRPTGSVDWSRVDYKGATERHGVSWESLFSEKNGSAVLNGPTGHPAIFARLGSRHPLASALADPAQYPREFLRSIESADDIECVGIISPKSIGQKYGNKIMLRIAPQYAASIATVKKSPQGLVIKVYLFYPT